MAELTIRSPGRALKVVRVDGDVFRIGRASDNDLQIDDLQTEPHHAELVREGATYAVRDLNAFSETYVNQELCRERTLEPGDEIRIGDVALLYHDRDGELAPSFLAEQRVPVEETFEPPGEHDREGRFALLYRVGKAVLSASTLDDLNDLALSLVFDCVNAERGALLLRDPDTHELQSKLLRNREGRRLGPDEMHVPRSIVREVLSGHVGLLTSDALHDPRFEMRASVRISQIRSALCAPLWEDGDILGVIYLDSRLRSYAFTVDDLTLLNAIGNLIAIRFNQDALHRKLAEERVARSHLGRYHSPDVVEEILNRTRENESADLGLEERDVSILFADVQDFTALAETLPASAVADFLNEYYTVATRVIFDHGGTVNEFIGDSVMAIFGAPVPHADHAERAVRAGIELLRQMLPEAASERAQIHLRVAVNSGRVVAGSVGPPNRLKYAVVGDTVNVAARIEGLGEPDSITLGENTVRCLGAAFACEDLGPTVVKGHERPIRLYRIR
ncbi:MAG TPA: adenylate/guanylate cyclase domain-containing protein, partial [Candidatus Saccharimonadales bacterium]|nr:adenylate/guanylate cyclase domain-containing protein [Candidatus Saccharimonadales bacterium]